MTLLGVIRHGPTPWNVERRIQGRTDISLSAAGRAALAGKRPPGQFKDARWVSSPLARAVETARLIGAPETLATDGRLAEMAWGEWEGRTLADLRAELGAAMAANEARGLHFQPAGGESPAQVQDRLGPWLREVGAGPGPVLAVTHKGVIRALLSLACGWDMTGPPPHDLDWACVHAFTVSEEGEVQLKEPNLPLAGASAGVAP